MGIAQEVGGVAHHDRVRRYILQDDTADSDETFGSNMRSVDHDAVAAQIAGIFNRYVPGYTHAPGKNAVISDEIIVTDDCVGQDVDMISNSNIGSDGDILEHNRSMTYAGHTRYARGWMDDRFKPFQGEACSGSDLLLLPKIVLAANAINEPAVFVLLCVCQRAKNRDAGNLASPSVGVVIQKAYRLVQGFAVGRIDVQKVIQDVNTVSASTKDDDFLCHILFSWNGVVMRWRSGLSGLLFDLLPNHFLDAFHNQIQIVLTQLWIQRQRNRFCESGVRGR